MFLEIFQITREKRKKSTSLSVSGRREWTKDSFYGKNDVNQVQILQFLFVLSSYISKWRGTLLLLFFPHVLWPLLFFFYYFTRTCLYIHKDCVSVFNFFLLIRFVTWQNGVKWFFRTWVGCWDCVCIFLMGCWTRNFWYR